MEFKIGDRVSKRSKATGEVYSEELIKNTNRLNDINDYIARGQTGHYAFEFWQPKEGEWVCVDRYDGNLFTVCKFNSHFLDYKDCEPFNGELPSFIKDN